MRERRLVELVGVLAREAAPAGPNESAANTATRSTAARVGHATRQAARSASESRRAAIRRDRAGVASYAMAGLEFYSAESYLQRNEDWIAAIAIVAVTIVIAEIVDRALARRGRGLTERMAGGELSAETTTRIRLVRRLIFALIIVIGLASPRSDSTRFARWPPACSLSAVLGLVVGFAARATLANAIAGIMLAVTQPIRIGDLVTFEDKTGAVEDVKLTYTYIRLDDGRRLIVPNEMLAQSSVENHTILDPRVQVEVSVWLRRARTPTARSS